ncbi:hypothetical protein JOL62DRAFT_18122 [Phyllosticta paracitricarpa]|uniref:Secreted protein n=1 Tax=Phyllosticta paracitricarpa TaxID=2016321 RepID=A0ABR1NAP8_9PEZI
MHALCCVTLLYPVVRALLLHLVSLYSRNASSSSFASPRWFVVGRYVAVSAAMKRLEGGQNAAAQKRKQKIEKQTLQNSGDRPCLPACLLNHTTHPGYHHRARNNSLQNFHHVWNIKQQ